ncbi:MAG TPA: SDR family NAD(P)-dependent oxidoreductase [Saprospiraceae bacterium]|nr:SDR family NAD(P)-dependent oxidoreductase [Saprospiraceae bacterium]HMQ84532.1 SDR family NAD(P)-dependent oxidoreductase [Saprospiraceae bacterium]
MSTRNIAIAYHAENQDFAQKIERELQPSIYRFQHYPCNRSSVQSSLSDQLLQQSFPILLLISDNFLKSAQCMNHGLRLLQDKRHLILPIITPGIIREDDGSAVPVATNFERVSDIIQYINYWQDQYLDLRKQKRQLQDINDEEFNAHLKVMREISSEAGEYLRLLRGINYMTLEHLMANHYEAFFKFNNDHGQWLEFKSKAVLTTDFATPSIVTPDPSEPELDLSDIPGIELLPDEGAGQHSDEKEELTTPEELAAYGSEVSDEVVSMPLQTQDGADLQHFGQEEEEEDVLDMSDEIGQSGSGDSTVEEGHYEGVTEEESDEMEEIEEVAMPVDMDEVEEEEDSDEEFDDDEEGEEDFESQTALVVEEALEYFNSGQTEKGLAFMAQSLEDQPQNTLLRYHYGVMVAQEGRDIEGALQILQPLMQESPINPDALFLLGELEELRGRYDAAQAYYSQLVELNPHYPNGYYRLGVILADQYPDQQKQAAKYLKKAAKLNESNPEIMYRYALLLGESLGKPKKAIGYLKDVLDLQPQHPFAYYDLALFYHQIGEKGKAQKAYLKSVEINPEFKTPQNDEAFGLAKVIKTSAAPSVHAGLGFDTIEALKENINRLEELLRNKEEQAEQLVQHLEAEEEEEAMPKNDITVMITGATSGIGQATAAIFAEMGYRLIITGRRLDRLKAFKEELEDDFSAEVCALHFDVRDQEAVESSLKALPEAWQQIDILVNNAGKAKGLAPIQEGELRHWEEMIDTNVKGLLYVTRAVAPGMVARKSGHIINIGSTAGKEVYPDGNVYCATKFAVDALTRSMRLDLVRHSIKVSQISPAHVEDTEFALVRFDGDADKAKIYEDFKPLNARDVAETIFFIASQPAHVNILDIVMQGVQQASSTLIDRSGRAQFEEEE